MKIVEKLGKIDKDDIGIAGQLDVQASPLWVRASLRIRKANI